MLNNKQKTIYNWLLNKPGYLKKGPESISKICNTRSNINCTITDAKMALKQAKSDILNKNTGKVSKLSSSVVKTPKNEVKTVNVIKSTYYDTDNVIFIPDLHAPFIKEGVLDFIKEIKAKYHCGSVIFAGDIIDGHAWSYHEHDPDGMSVGYELEAAIEQLQPWYEAFPYAISLMGNHDLLIQRKARTAGLSKKFIKDFGEVIQAPNTWEFKIEHFQDNVLYKHGNVGDAFKVAQQSRISTCQGHFHARTFVQWSVSEKDAIFGMQVGWGADRDKYAFDYGKPFAQKPIISTGVVLDKGNTPIVELMKL